MVGVTDGVSVIVGVTVGVSGTVPVMVGVTEIVGVTVGVIVIVGVGVGVAWGTTFVVKLLKSYTLTLPPLELFDAKLTKSLSSKE